MDKEMSRWIWDMNDTFNPKRINFANEIESFPLSEN